EDDVAGEHLPARVDVAADGLGDAEDDTAGERAPEIAETADDDRLEAEDQAGAPSGGIKARPDAEEDSGDGRDGERERHGKAEDVGAVQAHQLGDILVVGGGPEGAAERRAIE